MAAAMACSGGLGIIHRMMPPEQQAAEIGKVKSIQYSKLLYPNATIDTDSLLVVGAAVGVKGDFSERARLAVESGVNLLVVDIAHGHSDQTLRAIEVLKRAHPDTELIAGNVATMDGTRDIINAGADAVKVGIGPGGICSTRVVTGCGMPQITAILESSQYARKHDVSIIADGGIRSSGDITKAIAAGASAVMLGSMLAGAEESSAHVVTQGAQKYKITTGFVTLGMELTLKKLSNQYITEEELKNYVPEGVEATFPYTGPLQDTLIPYIGGLKSGMSYCGASSIQELWRRANFIQITRSGFTEGTPHALTRTEQIQPDYKTIFINEKRDVEAQ